MNSTTIFTIGRQFGSNGRTIGKALAEKVGLPYYDAELITHAAEISGLLEETVRKFDEKAPENKWHPYWFMPFPVNFEPLGQQIFNAQFKALENIADKGGAVIVGRCADYVLRDHKDLVSVFVHAPDEWRIENIKKRHPEDADNAETVMKRTDKSRAWYYSFYTGKTWGAAASYDLCLRSDLLTVDQAVQLICDFAAARRKTAEAK